MELGNIQDRLGWIIKEHYGSIEATYNYFLNFYKLQIYIKPYKYHYKVDIWLDYGHCSCFFCMLEVKDVRLIFGQVEEYVRTNYANIYWFPKFISIIEDSDLFYDIGFRCVEVRFPFFTNKFKLARLIVDVREDNIKELVEKYQNYLVNNWKTIESSNGIEKYYVQEKEISETDCTDPIFPG